MVNISTNYIRNIGNILVITEYFEGVNFEFVYESQLLQNLRRHISSKF